MAVKPAKVWGIDRPHSFFPVLRYIQPRFDISTPMSSFWIPSIHYGLPWFHLVKAIPPPLLCVMFDLQVQAPRNRTSRHETFPNCLAKSIGAESHEGHKAQLHGAFVWAIAPPSSGHQTCIGLPTQNHQPRANHHHHHPIHLASRPTPHQTTYHEGVFLKQHKSRLENGRANTLSTQTCNQPARMKPATSQVKQSMY